MSEKEKSVGDRSFDDFRQGSFGNSGQNLYVSKRGVLQRIHRFDVDGNGFADIFYANGQEIDECPPLALVSDPLKCPETRFLPALGAFDCCVVDLNGDGCEEIVVANQCDGTKSDVAASLYWGGPDGYSENRRTELYAPDSIGVAAGDFDGDGRPEIAFLSPGRLRIFSKGDCGYLGDGFTDLAVEAFSLAAGDLDGDGCADLYLRMREGAPRIYWGGPGGIRADRYTEVGEGDLPMANAPTLTTAAKRGYAPGWRAAIIGIDGVPHVCKPEKTAVSFYRIDRKRRLIPAFSLPAGGVVMAAAGRVTGAEYDDLLLAVCREEKGETEESWLLPGSAAGFNWKKRRALPTRNVRDAALIDLANCGRCSIVFAQGGDSVMYTTTSVVYPVDGRGKIDPAPRSFTTHNAVAVRAVRFGGDPAPGLLFVNHMGGRRLGDVPVYIYLNENGSFAPERRLELPGHSAVDLICADLNDDGRADLVVLNSAECAPQLDPGSFVYYQGEGGFDREHPQVIESFRAHGSAIGDFRRCGYLDLVVSGYRQPELRIFHGGPKGYAKKPSQIINMDVNSKGYKASRDRFNEENTFDDKNFGEARYLFAADFNNDGYLDLFVSQIRGQRAMILHGGPAGFSMDRVTFLPVEGSCCARAADLNGNGYLDLVVGGHGSWSKAQPYESALWIFWGGPEGFSQERCCMLPASSSNSLCIADFNRDGRPDIFVTSYQAPRNRDIDAYIYWNGPDGFSPRRRQRLFNHAGSGCMAVDFDEDGYIDLAVCHHRAYGNHIAESKVWWNGPDGFEPKKVTHLPTIGPLGMVTASPYNLMDGGEEEFYTSRAFGIPAGTERIAEVVLACELQRKTWVKLQLRTAATAELLERSAWFGASYRQNYFTGSGAVNAPVPVGHGVIQYRLALGARNGGNSPRVHEVKIVFQ